MRKFPAQKRFHRTPAEIITRIQIAHPAIKVLDEPQGVNNKITLRCTCGHMWKAAPYSLIKADGSAHRGCRNCGIKRVADYHRLNTHTFIQSAKKVHGLRYDYRCVHYVHGRAKVQIICLVHGSFFQSPHNHLSGRGCRKCGREQIAKAHEYSTAEFIKRAKLRHGSKYDYHQVQYKHNKTKIKIICKSHGGFWQRPHSHLNGRGCSKCSQESHPPKYRPQQIVTRIEEAHPNILVLRLPKKVTERIPVSCKTCGNLWTSKAPILIKADGSPYCGCPRCSSSKGEKITRTFLETNKIRFISQARLIPDTSHSFDFLLLDSKTLIEYQGQQHYRPVDFAGRGRAWASAHFKVTKRRDRFKSRWARKNGYRLIVIPYWTKDIPAFLSKRLNVKPTLSLAA